MCVCVFNCVHWLEKAVEISVGFLVKFVVHTSTVIADVVFVSECNEQKKRKKKSILYENDKSGN